MEIDGARLISRIFALGETGLDENGRRVRLAADDADRAARDLAQLAAA